MRDATPRWAYAGGLLVSLAISLSACSPCDWRYSGNNPKFWIEDVQNEVSLTQGLADMAQLYARGIRVSAALG